MLNPDAPAVEIANKQINHDPLNDHDYCSPNKRKLDSGRLGKSNQKSSSPQSNDNDDPKFPVNKIVPSTSSDISKTNINTKNINNSDLTRTDSNDNLSDSPSSSSSSSLSSSASSTNKNNLIIAQAIGKDLSGTQSQDKPAASKRRVGRPSKRDMADNLQQITPPVRSKRPRQNISVTDKSEWIMGDDQIDSVLSEHLDDETRRKKRLNSRDIDQAYEEESSSNSSCSNAGSDDDSEYNSEDDPDKLWCICRKPHDGKFMICCDTCKDWFHGHCVGVTKLMGDRFEKEGKEWFCAECSDKLRAGIPRNAIPTKINKKEKKKSRSGSSSASKRRRGRPRKSEITREISTRSSQRNLRKSLDSKLGVVDNGRLRRNLSKPDVRTESFDEFEDSQRLKVLIKERKKEFFYKRQLAEQQKAAKRNELGLGRGSLTANLSDSLDSLATSTNTPNMNNLPINIKSDHGKERVKPIVLQINTKKDPTSDQGSQRIVTAIVRSPKKNSNHFDTGGHTVNDLFTADPIQVNKKFKTENNFLKIPASDNNVSANETKFLQTPDASSKSEKHSDQSAESTPKRKRKDSDSCTNGSSNTGGSKHIAQKIKESLEARSRHIKDMDVSSEKIGSLAIEIEAQLNECFKEGTNKYMNKFRSLIFNLRDPKNQCLVTNVLSGEIAPSKLVRMSSDEMASNELAKWRERENKHSIELIKRDAQLAAQQVIVKKTHKGEEVISTPSINETEDPKAEASNQEPPTTPTKSVVKAEAKIESLNSRVNTLGSPPNKTPIVKQVNDSNGPLSNDKVSDTDPFFFLDTTKDHKNHVFDINCKICTKQDPKETTKVNEHPETDERTNESDQQQEQPKRFRVTIDTKLDPSDLSRLKEPLVKPVEQPPDVSDEDNSMTPAPDPHASNDEGESDYSIPPGLDDIEVQPTVSSVDSSQPCWTGTITMPDIAKFRARGKSVDGESEFLRHEISNDLTVCGRIAPDQVQGYIKKLKATTKNQIMLIQLFPLEAEDKPNFDVFFDYLYSRNRYGVIQASQFLKDFYILPIHERGSVPEVFRPTKSNSIDRKEPNCLLGLLVRSKRSPTTSSGYTPTPIK